MADRPTDLLTRSGRLLRIRPVEAAEAARHPVACAHAHLGARHLVAEIDGRIVAVLSCHAHGAVSHLHVCYPADVRGDGIGAHLLAIAGHGEPRGTVTWCG